jgi:hypothetical protein
MSSAAAREERDTRFSRRVSLGIDHMPGQTAYSLAKNHRGKKQGSEYAEMKSRHTATVVHFGPGLVFVN